MCLLTNYLPLLNDLLQVIALIMGSFWALYQFMKFRRLSPKLDTDNEVKFIRKKGDSAYLRIKVNIKNVGEVAVKGFKGKVSLCDFSEITHSEIKKLNNNELPNNICLFDFNLSNFDYKPELIEPGEKDYFIKTIKVDYLPNIIEMHSHIVNIHYKPKGRFFNKEEKEITHGWNNYTIHKINEENYG